MTKRRKSSEIRVIQYGIGPIGAACARAVTETPGLRLVGAVDIDPSKVGQPVGRLLGVRSAARAGLDRLRVSHDLAGAMANRKADVALHTTLSSVQEVLPQLRDCARAGLSVVSSTEELSCPWATDPKGAAALDRLAKRHGVAILGTGVNPGYVMDLLPIVASGASRGVKRVEVARVLDAGKRRASFQRKVGVGMAPQLVRRHLREGSMGHVGLLHSALLIGAACGLEPDDVRESGKPIVTDRHLDSALGAVVPGQVSGLSQTLVGKRRGREVLRLDMVMALGVENPYDAAVIHGEPIVRLRVEGGLWGDGATVSTLINSLPRILEAPAGLRTLLDMPIPRAFGAA